MIYDRLQIIKMHTGGGKYMNCKVVNKEEFKVIGKSIRVTTVGDKNFVDIPKFWDEANQTGLCEDLFKYASELGLLGICMEHDEAQKEFTYVIACEKTVEEIPKDLIEKEIPASTWAIFESIGAMPNAIQAVWKYIYSEWFPTAEYKHAGGAELEVYLPGNPNDENYKCEVWIPVVKK